jgi:hypothetical protein
LQLSSPNLTAEVGYHRISRLHCLEVLDVALNMADSMDNPSWRQVGLPWGKACTMADSMDNPSCGQVGLPWGKACTATNFTTEVVHMADSMDIPSCCQVGLPLGTAWVQRPTSQLRLFIWLILWIIPLVVKLGCHWERLGYSDQLHN